MAEDARGSIKEDLWKQNECQNERTLRAAGSKSCDQFNFKDAETLWDSTIFR